SGFGWRDMQEFAARCRDEDGEPIAEEFVLDTLVEEIEQLRVIARYAAAGRPTVVRLQTPFYSGDDPAGYFVKVLVGLRLHNELDPSKPIDENDEIERNAVVRRLNSEQQPIGSDEFWELWTGKAWVRLPSIDEVTQVDRAAHTYAETTDDKYAHL